MSELKNTITIAELIQLTGLSRPTVTAKLKVLGVSYTTGNRGLQQYNIGQLLRSLLQIASDDRKRHSDENPEADYKHRLTQAKAELAELELSKKRSEVINAEDALAAVTESFSEVRTGLLNLAPSLATKLATIDNPEHIASLIDQKITEALAPLHFELPEQQTDEIPDDSTDVQNEA